MKENREVKSDVFSMLMQEKKYALEVYNALNGSSYDDPELIEILSMDSGVTLTIKNDASFIIDTNLNLYEHQSTYNPNMPLRMLIYVADIYKKYVTSNELNLYGETQIKIPTPKVAVFYNGTRRRPEKEILKLSDMFTTNEASSLELECIVYNINPGNNTEFMKGCRVLSQYTAFIEIIRDNQQKNVENPIAKAIDKCIEEDILKEFLTANRDEVLRIMNIDMTFETREKYARRDALKEGIQLGRKEGIQLGRKEGILLGRKEGEIAFAKAYKKGMISKEDVLSLLDIPEEEFDELVCEYEASAGEE